MAVDIRVSCWVILIADEPNEASEQYAKELAQYIEQENKSSK